MTYFVQLIIPPNTTKSEPVREDLFIAPGSVNKVIVLHPTGCVSLVGVWFEYRSSRLWPTNDDGYFLGNGQVIEYFPDSELIEPPHVISVYGYNEDDTYIHRPLIMIEVDFAKVENIASLAGLAQRLNEALALQGNGDL